MRKSIVQMNMPREDGRRVDAPSGGGFGLAAIWTLLILSLAVVHGYFDRQIIAVMAEPIKLSLTLSDVEISLLSGLAFGLCVAIAMVPAGMLADRYDRVYLLSGGISLWSLMTIYGGFADGFPQLFISRLGVGLGEAIIVPATYSLVGELFDDRRRGLAIAVIVSSAPIGLGLASFLGGPLYQLVSSLEIGDYWRLRPLPWQSMLILTGLAGLALSGACLTVRDPRRGRSRGAKDERPAAIPLLPVLRSQNALFTPFAAGFALFSLAGIGGIAWAPALLERSFGWEPGRAGLFLGGLMIVSGICGAQLAGWLSMRIARAKRDVTLHAMGLACASLGILFIAMIVFRSPLIAVSVLGSVPFFLYGSSTLGSGLLLRIAPGGLHARLSASLALILTIAGTASGPTVFAYFSDRVFGGPGGLLQAISLVGGACLMAAALLFLLASRSLMKLEHGRI